MSQGDDDAILDVGSLKVAELKEELAKRNLPTNGLKKDLASRLEKALQSQESKGGDEVEQNVAGEKEGEVQEESQDAMEETIESNVDASSEGAKDTKATEVEDVESNNMPETEELEAKPSLIERIADETMKEDEVLVEQHEENMVQVDESMRSDEIKMTDGITETNDTSLQDRMGGIVSANDQDVIDLGGDVEVEVEMQSKEVDAASPRVLQQTDVKGAQISEQSTPSPQQSGVSPYSDPPTTLSEEETASSKTLSDLDEETIGLQKPSRSIYITGLVRPLTLASFRAKAEEFGELGGESVEEGHGIWLDGVKTHAYVTYQEEQTAVAAKAALSGSTYPPETGKMIQVYFVPQTLVKQCITIEEEAWQKDRGKVELRARKEQDSLLYSLHRLETTLAEVSRLDTTLPQSNRPNHNNQRGKASFGGRPQSSSRTVYMPSSNLQWGGHSYPTSRDHEKDYRGEYRRDNRQNHHGRGRYEEERGSSRADDRVRQVEARIRAERERGSRGFVNEDLMSGRSPQGIFYDGRGPSRQMDNSRWSNGDSSSRTAYVDRNRNLSPPPKRREYSDGPRDDRYRRDW